MGLSFQVPTYARPPVRSVGQVVAQTVAGDRPDGRAATESAAEGGGYVLLSGVGRLRLKSPLQAA